MSDRKNRGPVLIDLEDTQPTLAPEDAPPVPEIDAEPAPEGRAMQTITTLAARKPSRLARVFWAALVAFLSMVISIAAWDFVTTLLERNQILGAVVLGLGGILLIAMLAIALREFAGFSRLRRIDTLHRKAETALADDDLKTARDVTDDLEQLYASRSDTRWGRDRFAERKDEQYDASALLLLAEQEVLVPLDQAAMREVEAAARQVATVTALVPLALADVVVALSANIRMIRRIAEVYGGRSGTLGSWRLTRAVMAHLVATGAVAAGDDLIGSLAGGGVISKISRRFGEGVINGALTARVGVAAMEVCRPMPFSAGKRPSVSGLVRRALTGLFGSG